MGRRPTVAVVIADGLTVGISTGTYPPGELLPTQEAIGAMFRGDDGRNASRAAVIKALEILEGRGLVERVKGKGAKVIEQIPHKTGLARTLSVRRTGRIYEPGEYAVITAAEVVTAPPDVAITLGLEPGADAIRRHRITYSAEKTTDSVSTSWYDGAAADVAPLLLSTERIPQGSWAYLEAQTGRRAVRWEELVVARGATAEEAEELGIRPSAPVKVATLILRDGSDAVVEYGISVAISGRVAKYEGIIPE